MRKIDGRSSKGSQFTVNTAVFEMPPAVAVMVIVWVEGTCEVAIVKVEVVLFWGTITS